MPIWLCLLAQREPDLETLVAEGDRLMLKGKYEEAILQYEMAIEIEPRQSQPYIKLAETHATAGNTTEAMRTLQMGLRNIPGDAALAQYESVLQIVKSEYQSSGIVSQLTKKEEWMNRIASIESDK